MKMIAFTEKFCLNLSMSEALQWLSFLFDMGICALCASNIVLEPSLFILFILFICSLAPASLVGFCFIGSCLFVNLLILYLLGLGVRGMLEKSSIAQVSYLIWVYVVAGLLDWILQASGLDVKYPHLKIMELLLCRTHKIKWYVVLFTCVYRHALMTWSHKIFWPRCSWNCWPHFHDVLFTSSEFWCLYRMLFHCSFKMCQNRNQ